MEEQNNWKKRGPGKVQSTVKHYIFYSYYRKNTLPNNKVGRKEYNKFLNDLTKAFMDSMIEENTEIKLTGLGRFRIKETDSFRKDRYGELKLRKSPVDWDSTWKYWRTKYEGLLDSEIIKIDNKPILRFENEHRQGKIYSFYWDKITTILKNKSKYNFRPTRLAKEKLGKLLKTNDNIFYYG